MLDKADIAGGPGDTIYALATAPGRAGVAVIRLSGPDALPAARELSGGRPLPARRASLRVLSHAGERLDEAVVLAFPSPASFTGEDVVELQCHSSAAVIEAVSRALSNLGLRQAGPGEFTRRAVENGRMDLTEAEGLMDLIDAQTEGQRRQALAQMGGHLRDLYEGWRAGLLDALSQIEGEIDFADEADVPDALSYAAYPHLERVAASIADELAGADRARAVRTGIDIAIIGPPNAGKSTLLNRIARADVAITSPTAGTTRDVVAVPVTIAGQSVTLYDTAGLRETADDIEAEGVRRALARAQDAHLRIGLVREGMDAADLPLQDGDVQLRNVVGNPDNANEINVLEGHGLDHLLDRLASLVTQRFAGQEAAGLTRARHKRLAEDALASTRAAQANIAIAPELASEDIRRALRSLDELAGRADIEEVFDRIFSQFCVGK